MYYLDTAGEYVAAGLNTAGEYIDEFGDQVFIVGGQVFDAFGNILGEVADFGDSFVEETRDQIIGAGRDAAIASVITVGVVVLGIYVIAKVL